MFPADSAEAAEREESISAVCEFCGKPKNTKGAERAGIRAGLVQAGIARIYTDVFLRVFASPRLISLPTAKGIPADSAEAAEREESISQSSKELK